MHDDNNITDLDMAQGTESEPYERMTATHESEPSRIEFHVQMHNRVLADMEDLIVDAAARIMLGKIRDNDLAKQIQDRTLELIQEKLDGKLQGLTKEIIDQPVISQYGDKKPVTMRELIGLAARDYLQTNVDGSSGKVESGYSSRKIPRIQYIAEQFLAATFKREIENEVRTAAHEVKTEMRKQFDEMLNKEKARFREALELATKAN